MAIGNFNNRSNPIIKCIFFKQLSSLSILFLLLFGLKCRVSYYINALSSFIVDCILNIQFSSVILLLVLMSGDVAENPGPFENSTELQNCLSIAHLNVRSIRTKLDYIKDFFSRFWYFMFYRDPSYEWHIDRISSIGRFYWPISTWQDCIFKRITYLCLK